MAKEPQIQVQKLQAKLDALKKKREKKLAKADLELDRSNREAASRHHQSYKQAMKEFDPKISELAEQLKAVEKQARRKNG